MQGTIGIRSVQALKPNTILWDDRVTGFCCRRQRGSARVYWVKYREPTSGEWRWFKIGRDGAPWSPDGARGEAQRILGLVADRRDPAGERDADRKAATIDELCTFYLADAEAGRLLTRRGAGKKQTTLDCDKGRINRHIRPLVGKLKVAAITRQDVERFMHDVAAGKTAGKVKGAHRVGYVRGGKGAASKAVSLLGAILAYGIKQGLRADNPVHGVTRFRDGKRERRLTDGEYQRLGEALRKSAATLWRPTLAATKFIVLTGWRRSEVLSLRWSDIDLGRRTARLSDTKTGASVRALSRAACESLLSAQEWKIDEASVVFPQAKGNNAIASYHNFWAKIAQIAELPADISPHVLRHSFASLAADLGCSELVIAALIGHRLGTMTSRYTHFADAFLVAAADKVADRILELIGEAPERGQVVDLAAARG